MLAKVYSYGLSGLEAYPILIETDVSAGLPGTAIVGLPDNAIRESKERVRSAVRNSGYTYPCRRITVNLSPADVKKEGPSFDLAIALGILAATQQIDPQKLKNFIILGELSLDGKIRAVKGILPIILSMPANQFEGIIVPLGNATEAAITGKIPVFPMNSLTEVVHFLYNAESLKPLSQQQKIPSFEKKNYEVDFSDVKGQGYVKRGLEIAACGGHNVLMLGPPGSGKTMLAKRLPTILPEMTFEESLETTKIHSTMGLVPPAQGLMTLRPFRSPHHTASDVALVGGGTNPKPGEVTLAHNGILFLDELPEFNRNVLEALRQPLEDRYVTVSRAAKTVRFPANFMLVASMNPCPCGYLTDKRKECHCRPQQIQNYLSKISGPLLDRIDIHLEVPALRPTELMTTSPHPAESSAAIRERTIKARAIQLKRFQNHSPATAAQIPATENSGAVNSASAGGIFANAQMGQEKIRVNSAASGTCPANGGKIFANAQMSQKQIKEFCQLSGESRELLHKAVEELGFSARAYDKILKVSRTIADLENSADILPSHIAEAIQYRCLDRREWC